MKYLKQLSIGLLVVGKMATTTYGALLVDDTWADGSRSEQKLPTDSAWFGSSSTNLVSKAGVLSLFSSASSRQFVTYFTPAGKPARLAKVGDSISASLTFTPADAAEENPSRNMRFGLFDSSVGKRLSADGTPNGSSVVGYALFLNFARSFGAANALQVNDRDRTANTDLLGSSSAYTCLTSSGQPDNHSTAFTNGGTYYLQFSVQRASDNSVEIKTVITGGGLSITNSAIDSGVIVTSFDTFAMRSTSAVGTAGRLDLTRFTVESRSR